MKIKVGIPRLRVGILRHQDTPGHLPGVEQTVVSRQSPSLASIAFASQVCRGYAGSSDHCRGILVHVCIEMMPLRRSWSHFRAKAAKSSK